MIAQLPSQKRPVYIIGAGGIVNDAHLPAYKIAEFNVQGIFDINIEKANATAEKFSIPNVFAKLDEMISASSLDAIYDVAVPGSQTIPVLTELPNGSAVLLQKPMGENFDEAKQILKMVRHKKLLAAV